MNEYPSRVTLYDDGVYRWCYDMDMWQNRYMLRVDRAANKAEIKKAVEDFFNVTVLSVNVQNYAGKKRVLRNRRTVQAPDWKRAIVALKPGDKIDLI